MDINEYRRQTTNATDWSTLPATRITFTALYTCIIVFACTGSPGWRVADTQSFLLQA